MSAVLRKKLESSGGVPPRVVQNTAFWKTLERTISAWIESVLEVECQVRLQSRETSSGAALADDLFGAYVYGFHTPGQDFVVAVSIDNLVASRVAAKKLKQAATDLSEAPPLFLQLLLEQPAKQLSDALTRAFERTGPDGVLPVLTPMSGLDYEGHCLLVYVLADLDGQAVRVGVALDLETVLAMAGAGGEKASGRTGLSLAKLGRLTQPRVQNSTVQLRVVLDRLPMNIADCARLEEGTVITLPGTDRAKLKVTAETVEGPVDIADGELGVWKHRRAVRLKSPIDPTFIKEVSA